MCWTRQTSLQGQHCSNSSSLCPAAMLLPALKLPRPFTTDLLSSVRNALPCLVQPCAALPCAALPCPALPCFDHLYLLWVSRKYGCTSAVTLLDSSCSMACLFVPGRPVGWFVWRSVCLSVCLLSACIMFCYLSCCLFTL